MLALDQQADTDRLFAPGDHSAFILLAPFDELPVQISNVHGFWDRHPVITPEAPSFSLNATLFVRLGWRAELGFESPVRSQSHEPRCPFSPRPPKNLLHGRGQIV